MSFIKLYISLELLHYLHPIIIFSKTYIELCIHIIFIVVWYITGKIYYNSFSHSTLDGYELFPIFGYYKNHYKCSWARSLMIVCTSFCWIYMQEWYFFFCLLKMNTKIINFQLSFLLCAFKTNNISQVMALAVVYTFRYLIFLLSLSSHFFPLYCDFFDCKLFWKTFLDSHAYHFFLYILCYWFLAFSTVARKHALYNLNLWKYV